MAVEYALAGLVRAMPGAVVIPEPYTRVGFEDDLRSAVADPSQLPRDPAEKKAAARAAVEWLRKLAVGDVPGYDVRVPQLPDDERERNLTALRFLTDEAYAVGLESSSDCGRTRTSGSTARTRTRRSRA